MPNLPSSNLEGGIDFEFLIKYEGQEHSFPLLNSINNPIECVVAKPPIINSVSSTTIIKGGELTVFGSNLYFSYFNGDNTIINQSSKLELKEGGTTNYLNQMDLNNDGSISFNISDDIKSGTYNLAFKNNIESFEKVEINSMLTIELPNSNHPSLIVTEAKIYSNIDQNTPKQILITFNGNIGNVEIKEIKIGNSFSSIIIGNYLTYTSTILTNALSDNDFSNFYYGSNLHDGYVIIEDGGVEYKLPFKLTR
ncbi:hypothetical protein [Polaribacter sp. HL-MS24]|uniref:hypothetical protein n=1 Tax=Polaribacter sp. HL-MS24 TaxID=3077735 RepID=UPI0029343570|nr:hypothetical protein [Polaribacter sp. HL-MS24]WOC39611.1 hypothetical protein RRF69_08050 [Polaribacter sp. HL-MS24]